MRWTVSAAGSCPMRLQLVDGSLERARALESRRRTRRCGTLDDIHEAHRKIRPNLAKPAAVATRVTGSNLLEGMAGHRMRAGQ